MFQATKRTNLLWVLAAALLAAAALSGASRAVAAGNPPFELPPPQELKKLRSAVIETNKGNIYLELFPEDAPWHVANLKYLADSGFYKNLRFHLYEPDYVIQTGAPNERMNSGPGYTLPPEFNTRRHVQGTLSMVRKPNELDFDHSRRSHGSQFRILLRPSRKMDGYFTIFGRVIKGMNVAQRLRKGDVVKDLHVYVSPDGK